MPAAGAAATAADYQYVLDWIVIIAALTCLVVLARELRRLEEPTVVVDDGGGD